LPYAGDEFAMVILLPDKKDGLVELEQKLTADKLKDWLSSMKKTYLDYIHIPKFKVRWGTKNIEEELKEMGMVTAFTGKADFTGMTDEKPGLFIDKVFHQAFVEVNEEGTEAAAATAVIILGEKGLPSGFRADHPFIFLIYHKETKTVLFLGRVVNPKSE